MAALLTSISIDRTQLERTSHSLVRSDILDQVTVLDEKKNLLKNIYKLNKCFSKCKTKLDVGLNVRNWEKGVITCI